MVITVILNILKILGIILLSLIGLILFLLLIIFFVPVRYKLGFARTGTDTDPPVEAKGYVSWLLHIIHVSLYYPEKDNRIVIVRVFGIPVFKAKLTEEEKKKHEEKKKKKLQKQAEKQLEQVKSKHADDNSENERNWEPSIESSGSGGAGTDSVQNAQTGADTGINGDPETDTSENIIDWEKIDSEEYERFYEKHDDMTGDEESGETEDPAGKNANREKKSIFSRITEFFNKIAYTIRRTYDKIVDSLNKIAGNTDKLKKDIHYYHTIITSELFEREFAKIKKKLLKLLRELRPRKCEIALEVGFDDPYTTGEVLAISGMLYPVIGRYVQINGNFEEEIIRGAGRIKGRIYVFSLVKLGIWYLTDKDLKKLMRLFKKEPPKEHRRHKKAGGSTDG